MLSSKTIIGSFPPNFASQVLASQGYDRCSLAAMIFLPVCCDPIKAMRSMGCATNAFP